MSGVPLPGAKMITSSRFHAPPLPDIALAKGSSAPPSISIRTSLPSAKKPMERLSHDQKGNLAFSVPTNGRDETESKERSHKSDRPSDVPTKTIFLPSGEMARESGRRVGGVAISNRISAGGCRTVADLRDQTSPATA